VGKVLANGRIHIERGHFPRKKITCHWQVINKVGFREDKVMVYW
jgi:hypothetical protein